MRTVLTETHLPRFRALSTEAVQLLTDRLVRCHAMPPLQQPIDTGDQVFELCREYGLDHAGVVLTLARETGPVGLSAIEALVGRPISPWGTSTEARIANIQPKLRGVAAPRTHATDHLVVTYVPPNPKRPSTAGWERYQIWRVGYTVGELKARGLWPADVKWEMERNTVQFADAGTPPALSAIAERQREEASESRTAE